MNLDSESAIEAIVSEAWRSEKRAQRRAAALTVVSILLAGVLLVATTWTVARARAEVRATADSVRVLHDSLAALEARATARRATLDSLSRETDNVTAKLTAARAAVEKAQQALPAAGTATDTAVRMAVRNASSLLNEAQTASKKTTETLREVAYSGTMRPGSPVTVTIRLPYRASLRYRRWISPENRDTLGTFEAGETPVKLPYGGRIYFEATNLATGKVIERMANCTHDCQVSFE